MVIAVYNQKGGTGKSFIASHIAMLLGYYHHKVCLVDMDGQASSMKWVGGQNSDRTWRWNGEDKVMTSRGVDLVWGKHPDYNSGEDDDGPPLPGGYEFVVVDCNPSLASLHSFIDRLDLIIIPVIGRFSFDSATDVKEIVSSLRGQVRVSVLKNQMLPARMVASREEEAWLGQVGAEIFPFGFLRDGKIRSAEMQGCPVWEVMYGDRSAVMNSLRAVCTELVRTEIPTSRRMKRSSMGPVVEVGGDSE